MPSKLLSSNLSETSGTTRVSWPSFLIISSIQIFTGPRTSPFEYKKAEEYPDPAVLKAYAQQGLAEFEKHLRTTTPDALEEIVEIPWFQPTLKISRRQALTQAAMHSHYHRGQNATRFRELGGVPPTTDFILWLHKGQPPAEWP